ncbi:hypothetical protein IFR05_003947 [Cadophora sp. M221]|nr:hypothetical protein IFR05_003947 [Cadophora sp. M221]
MEEADSLLEGLDVEMTDTQESLTPETASPPFSSFIKFQTLPLELQVMVWKFTFPGRRLIQFGVPYRILMSPNCHVDPPLPIAHSVCKQSRDILLRYYRVIYEHYPPETHGYRTHSARPSRSFLGGPFHRPIFFDPTMDQFCIDASEMNQQSNRTEIAKIKTKFPGSLDNVTVLEVFNTEWVSITFLWNPISSYEHVRFGALKFFPNLEELHLVAGKHTDQALRASYGKGVLATGQAHDAVMRWYRQARDRDAEGFERKIPRVYFHGKREEQAMTDEEIRSLARIHTREDEDQEVSW